MAKRKCAIETTKQSKFAIGKCHFPCLLLVFFYSVFFSFISFYFFAYISIASLREVGKRENKQINKKGTTWLLRTYGFYRHGTEQACSMCYVFLSETVAAGQHTRIWKTLHLVRYALRAIVMSLGRAERELLEKSRANTDPRHTWSLDRNDRLISFPLFLYFYCFYHNYCYTTPSSFLHST